MFSLTHILSKLFILFLLTIQLAGCDSAPQLKPLASDAVILAFGDSLTYGTGATREQSYPARLQTLIGRSVINAGVPGEISQSGLQRLPALLKQHQPGLLILCHGGNDILRRNNLEQTRSNLQKMIDLATAANAQVLLIGVPQFGVFLSPAPFYSELADSNRLPIENDVLSEILKKNAMKADHIHPNAAGYSLVAERIQRLLIQTGAIEEGK